jgi:formylglycine-generating enzyme required for sulfatase activity
MDDHPIVHVSWADASAYAQWAGKQLPTEAQWERAARFGRKATQFVWGDELTPKAQHMANIWQGTFPHENSAEDGFVGLAPVRSFPPNALGLYDMAGNVWEWTTDLFHPDAYLYRVRQLSDGQSCSNPIGPASTADPRNPFSTDSRVQKGGSFLCHASYCSSYRPSAKMASPPDTGMSHIGFRCVMSASVLTHQPPHDNTEGGDHE